ncbi:hypothetical protein EVAR_29270_1 [Eumeta japonica]|uniref:Uncharacterized protein n=1 Tax=Eumeta variegata TaxID=151549 RepID=A0A4C1VX99_EUMVA|nr:hypothetical protein EVAR_29270_1 [Eumeta japonica]
MKDVYDVKGFVPSVQIIHLEGSSHAGFTYCPSGELSRPPLRRLISGCSGRGRTRTPGLMRAGDVKRIRRVPDRRPR